MPFIDLQNITTDRIDATSFTSNEVEAAVLRLDKIHPQVSGNKWFKLRYYLEAAKTENKHTVVTRGGAWSNHIIATAVACRENGLNSIGIIRGEEPRQLSPTLKAAREAGMQLYFTRRDIYKSGFLPPEFDTPDHYQIPEGGYGINGIKGSATIMDHFDKKAYTHICCAAGTGTMTAGLASVADQSTMIVSISVLKNNFGLEESVSRLIPGNKTHIHFNHDYHFSGYAKHNDELIRFMNRFYGQTGIVSDFVYTAKLFFAISDLAAKNFFPRGSHVLMIHSGGLQGNTSLNKGTLIF